MFEERNLKLDLLALGLLALTIFLAASLLSYSPSDPPSELVFPEQTETLNVCGRSGAMVGKMLFSAIGIGAYYLLFSLAVLDAVLLTRRTVNDPLLRAGGWLLSLAGITALAAMALPSASPGPVIGSGGYLGAAGRGLLEMNFASVGAYILATSIVLGGLLLCTDYVLVRILAWTVGRPVTGLGRGMIHVGGAYMGRFALGRDETEQYKHEAEKKEQEAEDDMSITIAGRSAAGEDKQEDEKGPSKTTSTRKSLAGMLRIKKPQKADCQMMIAELDAGSDNPAVADYELPNIEMLLEGESFQFEEHEKEVRRSAKILEKTFAEFGFNIRVVEIQTGPVIAQFEVELEAGLRLSKIVGLADDLAVALRVPSVRIVAPIPGKNTVGVEVPNAERHLVRLREVIEETSSKTRRMRIPLFLGKDVAGNSMVVDLAGLPHLLIAGRTGTGKSVCLNSIIMSILMTRRPDEVRLLLIDPKMVELSPYKRLPHLMHPVVTDMRKAEAILAWAVEKMEERYQLMARAGVRHVSAYNQLGEEELMERLQPESDEDRKHIPIQLPYIVIVADELADLMITSAREVEAHIIRLAQKSRAVGIHLVLATQKPTVDIITGLIKSNLPARISFQVASRTDSRVVLDEMGADKLLGNGDMLFLWPGTSTLIRGQGTYLSDDEISAVIAKVATDKPQFVRELVQLEAATDRNGRPQFGDRDELYEAAVDVVVREGRGSVSLLQRNLGIGYGRAARLIDYMAEDGFVGPYNGSQARDVLITLEDWERMTGEATGQTFTTSKPRQSNKITFQPADEPVRSKVVDVQLEEKNAEDKYGEEDEERDEEYQEDYAEDEYDEEYAEDETDELLDEDEEDEDDEEEYEEDELEHEKELEDEEEEEEWTVESA